MLTWGGFARPKPGAGLVSRSLAPKHACPGPGTLKLGSRASGTVAPALSPGRPCRGEIPNDPRPRLRDAPGPLDRVLGCAQQSSPPDRSHTPHARSDGPPEFRADCALGARIWCRLRGSRLEAPVHVHARDRPLGVRRLLFIRQDLAGLGVGCSPRSPSLSLFCALCCPSVSPLPFPGVILLVSLSGAPSSAASYFSPLLFVHAPGEGAFGPGRETQSDLIQQCFARTWSESFALSSAVAAACSLSRRLPDLVFKLGAQACAIRFWRIASS